jgi:hypothetical protein
MFLWCEGTIVLGTEYAAAFDELELRYYKGGSLIMATGRIHMVV